MADAVFWDVITEQGVLLVAKYREDKKPAPVTGEGLKIAAFDLDSTLITTSSKILHAENEQDWEFLYPSIISKLHTIHTSGYKIVIFTNQGRLTDSLGSLSPSVLPFKLKIGAIFHALQIPITIYVACANDIYRKPRTGGWKEMLKDMEEWEVSMEESFMCGDAAGRDEDHSDADVHFAVNLGISFLTPEEFFLSENQREGKEVGDLFDPSWYLIRCSSLNEVTVPIHSPAKQELIVMIGPPGAGKTTYHNKYLLPLGYERIHQDAGSSQAVCLVAAKHLLSKNHSAKIVIDEPNFNIQTRKFWILIAKEYGIGVRAFHFATPIDLCLHNDTVRALAQPQTLFNPEKRPIHPRLLFRELVKEFQEPRVEEGFDEVVRVEFKWSGTDEELLVWRKHWL